MKRVYLDYAATTPVDERVLEAMKPFWNERFGNPSSIHSFGQENLEAVEHARSIIAEGLNADTTEIIFTGSGTESDNMAIKGVGQASLEKGNHIITSSIEHHAVGHSCEFMESHGFDITYLKADRLGLINPSDVKKAITNKTILITIMLANNEIGTIQPVAEIGAIAKENGIPFHTDAVQAFGHIPIDVDAMHIDLLSLSAHKLYGPKGIGALYMRKDTPFASFMHGGSQEAGRRSSTHNVTGIVGLGKAAETAFSDIDNENKRITALRNDLQDRILQTIDGVHVNGHPEQRLPNNLNLSIENVEGESLLINLDIEGIAGSSGSACSSGSTEPSHVLRALGLSDELSRGSLRLSLGRFTTKDEIDYTVATLVKVVKHLRSLSSFSESTR